MDFGLAQGMVGSQGWESVSIAVSKSGPYCESRSNSTLQAVNAAGVVGSRVGHGTGACSIRQVFMSACVKLILPGESLSMFVEEYI